MYHHVARAETGRLLWSSHAEAARLWSLLLPLPGRFHLMLMPDHVHLTATGDVRLALGVAMSAYARWRNPRHAHRGPLWQPAPPPTFAAGAQKIRRDERYIALNPCRKGLCDDPLAWPWSTHRDRVGLAWPPVVDRAQDPLRHHRYVSGDPHVDVRGTDLPAEPRNDLRVGDVLCAVSALAREPLPLIRGSARSLAIRAARTLTTATVAEIATVIGVSRRTVEGVSGRRTPEIALVARVACDPRFTALEGGDLRAGWYPYRNFR